MYDKMFVVIFLIFAGLFTAGVTYDIPEFEYQCFADTCTFPTQFCNTESLIRQCSPCEAICRDKNVPKGCKYICGVIGKNDTTKASQHAHLPPCEDHSQHSSTQGWKIAFLVGTHVLAICFGGVIVLIWGVWTRKKKKLADQGQLLLDQSQQDGVTRNDTSKKEMRVEIDMDQIEAEEGGNTCHMPTTKRTRHDSTRSY